MNTKITISLAAALAFALSGCGGAEPKEETKDLNETPGIKLSGALGSSYQQAKPGMPATRVGGRVSQVWAVPVNGSGGGTTVDFDAAAKADVASDRTFSLSVQEGRDYVLLLMDTTAALRDQITGYVALTELGGAASMLYMPVSRAASEEDFRLGTLEEDVASREGRSPALNTTTAEQFRLSLDQLRELASVDDTFKAIKNQYVNGNWGGRSQFHEMELGFNWFIPYSVLQGTGTTDLALPSAHPVNVDLTPAGEYSGYGIRVNTNQDLSPSADTVCPPDGTYWTDTETQNGSLLAIQPPPGSSITHSRTGVVYGDSTPIANEGGTYQSGQTGTGTGLGNHFYDSGCMDADFAITGATYEQGPWWSFGLWGNDYLLGEVPAGEWIVTKGGTEIAWFDVAAAYPFDASGNILAYVPVPQVATDANDRVTGITVDWYRWDGSAYLPADIATMEMLVGTFQVGLIDDNFQTTGNRAEGHVQTETAPTSFDFAAIAASNTSLADGYDWYFRTDGTLDGNTATNEYHIESLGINYEMGGVWYAFAYSNESP